ncbi:MAG: allantoicase [Pseudomonadota bacterium]
MDSIIAKAAVPPDWAADSINLASPRLGTETVRCTDDAFAAMARMIQDGPAIFKPGVFDTFGKWMDGWESRRRRNSGHDWCVIRLGVAGKVHGFDIDTSHFTGNFPPAASIWASDSEDEPSSDNAWTEIVPSTDLGPSAHHFVRTDHPGPWRWLRLNIFPDGGVARLRVFGDPVARFQGDGPFELSALKHGGRVIAYNDAHYGDVWALLTDGRGVNMGDGWETRRRREPGNDWLIVALGAPGLIERVEVDTAHFKGNFPDRCSLQAANVTWGTDRSASVQALYWPTLMEERSLAADAIHHFDGGDLADLGPVSHVKLNIHPDGGVSRLRIWGRPV